MRLVAGNPSFIPLPVSGILSFFIDTRINPREKHLFCLCYDELIEHNIHSFYAICALLTIISLLQKSQEKWNFCSTLEGIWRVEVIRAVSHTNCVISINILVFKIILVIYQIPFGSRTIDSNPLACNCSSKWIQRQMYKPTGILGPLWDQITCVDENKNIQRLANLSIQGCGKLSKIFSFYGVLSRLIVACF